MRTARELGNALDPFRRAVTGAIRRMSITLTKGAFWQVVGFRLPNGDEVTKAETFTGAGHYARPPENGKLEAIVLMVGADADHPVIVAVRDEKTRAAIASALKVDETMVYNSKAFVHIKDDGTIEARTPGGEAVALAKASELQAVAQHFYGHSHLQPGAPPIPTFDPLDPPSSPEPMANAGQPGTTKLKGE